MHRTVMLGETLAWLAVRPGGRYIDGTLGGGGHAEAILRAGGPGTRLLGLDRDDAALGRARERLAPFGEQVVAVHANFADMARVAAAHGFEAVDGVVLDLGVSSFQLDEAHRGFSFQQDGPLDMRMDTSRGETAGELLARHGDDWRGLAELLRTWGEEPQATRVAKAIVDAGQRSPLRTTAQLAEVVERAVGGRRGSPRHPATRTFQALRMAVNGETGFIARGVEAALGLLEIGGRMAVLTFHSIEDRLVKQAFVAHAGRWESLQQGGERWVGSEPAVSLLTRKPVTPGEAETGENPRSRSAKLRVVERVPRPDEKSRKGDRMHGAPRTERRCDPRPQAEDGLHLSVQARVRHVAERFSGAA